MTENNVLIGEFFYSNPDNTNPTANTGISRYVELLMKYNTRINLVSRQITPDNLNQLLLESVALDQYITFNTIVDAGSGNGLVGIPIAILNQNKKIILVEPTQKKAHFLQYIKETMNLDNIVIQPVSLEEYLKKREKRNLSLISRGFPNLGALALYVRKGLVNEAVIITSENKLKNFQTPLETLSKKTYNLPLRDSIKILKLEITAREH